MTMYDYCLEQPKVLKDILANRAEYMDPFVQRFEQLRPDRIYLIASGSSLNAALAAQPFMEQVLGLEVQACASSCLPVVRGERPLLIFISQGGNSTNTVAAIQKMQQHAFIALTGVEKCRINDLFDHMLIHCGIETAGPKTKGYTSTVLTLCLMALEAARACELKTQAEYEEYVNGFQGALDALEGEIAQARAWYDRNEESLMKLKKCFVVGKHTGAQAARESGLKLQETVLIPMLSYEFEEYLHGPSLAIDAEMGGFYLMPEKSDPDYERMAALVKFHRNICPMVYAVGGGEDLNAPQDCPIGVDAPWYARVYSWCLPCQITGALLPDKMGIVEDLFDKLDEVLGIKYKKK